MNCLKISYNFSIVYGKIVAHTHFTSSFNHPPKIHGQLSLSILLYSSGLLISSNRPLRIASLGFCTLCTSYYPVDYNGDVQKAEGPFSIAE